MIDLNNTECIFPLLLPGGINCSKKGKCETGNTCLCENSYVGIGDFNLVAQDCDINIKAAKALWSLLVASSLLALSVSLYHLLLLIRFRALYTRVFRKNFLFFAFVFCGSILIVVVSSLKVKDLANGSNEHIIGKNIAETIAFGLGALLWWTSAFLFMRRLIKLYIRQLLISPVGYSRNRFQRCRRFPFWLAIVSITIVVIIFPCMCLVDPRHCYIYGICHFLSGALVVAVYTFYYNSRYVKHLITELKVGVNRVETRALNHEVDLHMQKVLESIIFKLQFQKRHADIQGFIVVITYALTGIWPYLFRRATYAIPIAFSSGGIMISILCTIIGIELRLTAANSTKVISSFHSFMGAATRMSYQGSVRSRNFISLDHDNSSVAIEHYIEQ